jgi:hypothetical protein
MTEPYKPKADLPAVIEAAPVHWANTPTRAGAVTVLTDPVEENKRLRGLLAEHLAWYDGKGPENIEQELDLIIRSRAAVKP